MKSNLSKVGSNFHEMTSPVGLRKPLRSGESQKEWIRWEEAIKTHLSERCHVDLDRL